MKKSIQIQIPEPCHENWDKMTAANQGRFCNACSKVVVDFSMMSDKEILNHISTVGGKICGRVNDDQLNRPIQMPAEPRRISFKYFWGLLLSSFLISYKTNAQGKIKIDTIASPIPKPVDNTNMVIVVGGVKVSEDVEFVRGRQLIKGCVTDQEGNAIPNASVKIANSKYGKVADSKGEFKFKVPTTLWNVELVVSSIGYETVSLSLKDQDPEDVNIVMVSSKRDVLGEVVVVAHQMTSCNVRMGGLTYGITVQDNSLKAKWDELVGRNEIKIYPNPVAPGTAFNISFSLNEPGNYKLELYDASGRLIHESRIPILSKKQVMNFGSDLSLIPGVYFLNIMSGKGEKIYSGSLLVQ